MYIENVVIWTSDLERLRAFYETYFSAQAGPKYTSPIKLFESYFLVFTSGTRLVIMFRPDISASRQDAGRTTPSYAHLTFGLPSKAQVDALTACLGADGYAVIDGLRVKNQVHDEYRRERQHNPKRQYCQRRCLSLCKQDQ
jgi:lactoylglutathione lyase